MPKQNSPNTTIDKPFNFLNRENRNLFEMDVVGIILRDMMPLKELLNTMMHPYKDLPEKKIAFNDFAPLFFAHTKSKEQVLYSFMKNIQEFKPLAIESEIRNALAQQILEDCKHTQDERLLNMKLKVLSETVEDNFKNEENELLQFQIHSKISDRSRLGDQFLKCKVDFLIINYESLFINGQNDRRLPAH